MSATAICPEPLTLRGGLTLDELLTRAYEDAQAYGGTDCPVCGGHLGPRELDAGCDDCGARLF
jgi:hypothetical protein